MSIQQLDRKTTEGSRANALHTNVTASGGATKTLTAADSGGTWLWDAATGVAYTLPAPVVGMTFRFVCTVTVTSNAHSVTTDAATTFLQGMVWQGTAASATMEVQSGDGSSDVAVSMNGTTTGGVESTDLTFTCITATQWQVSGGIMGSGTLATPFA